MVNIQVQTLSLRVQIYLGEAIQNVSRKWIAASLTLLAMTMVGEVYNGIV